MDWLILSTTGKRPYWGICPTWLTALHAVALSVLLGFPVRGFLTGKKRGLRQSAFFMFGAILVASECKVRGVETNRAAAQDRHARVFSSVVFERHRIGRVRQLGDIQIVHSFHILHA